MRKIYKLTKYEIAEIMATHIAKVENISHNFTYNVSLTTTPSDNNFYIEVELVKEEPYNEL